METIKGTTLKTFSLLERLRRVSDLIFFERPLLIHYRTNSGESYLYLWCEMSEDTERWLLFAVDEKPLDEYKKGTVPLRDLILSSRDGFVYLIDQLESQRPNTCHVVSIGDLPKLYLPSIDSFYKFEQVDASDTPYSIAIQDRWSLEDLEHFPHDYSQVYFFAYAFKQVVIKNAQKVKSAIGTLPWVGGFSYMHFYHDLQGLIPRIDRPEIKSMHYASPGWIELKLDLQTALEAKKLISNYLANEVIINTLVFEIREVLRQKNLLGVSGKPVGATILQADLKYCSDAAKKLSFVLDFAEISELESLSPNSLASLKILMSFIRRIKRVSVFVSDGKVTF